MSVFFDQATWQNKIINEMLRKGLSERKNKNNMKTLANKKVYVAGKSAEIQKKAFELGYSWFGNDRVRYADEPYLFFDSKCNISHSNFMKTFYSDPKEEITAEEILAMEVKKPEEKFEPFQKVLVRDHDNEEWKPKFFEKKDQYQCEYPYFTIEELNFKQCIDYKSNKHLIFTTDKP